MARLYWKNFVPVCRCPYTSPVQCRAYFTGMPELYCETKAPFKGNSKQRPPCKAESSTQPGFFSYSIGIFSKLHTVFVPGSLI